MLDTNAFDFIFDNDLIDKVNALVKNGKIILCSTHVQDDEIEKIPYQIKKEKIKTILYKPVIASVGFSATDEPTNRGYVGARSDLCIAIDSDDAEIIKNGSYGTPEVTKAQSDHRPPLRSCQGGELQIPKVKGHNICCLGEFC